MYDFLIEKGMNSIFVPRISIRISLINLCFGTFFPHLSYLQQHPFTLCASLSSSDTPSTPSFNPSVLLGLACFFASMPKRCAYNIYVHSIIWLNANSTLVAFKALVSRKNIPTQSFRPTNHFS